MIDVAALNGRRASAVPAIAMRDTDDDAQVQRGQSPSIFLYGIKIPAFAEPWHDATVDGHGQENV